ncbi:hypothetical protein [Pseudomonas sp. BF-RE-29]|uniref:hypothetical protein n=1 Tax=Pseudomonas sp. BF-RE-29 TaxID=2832378 RepID=UPI001CBD43C5|nr:hypothetical protein [Pseudomonas sp. BF-RE-29]
MSGASQLVADLFGKVFRLGAGLDRIEQAEKLEMETCIYNEPVLIPMELTQGRKAWLDYPANAQVLPDKVRVTVRLGNLFDVIGIVSGPFDSWSAVNQQAAEVANNWYDRGNA